MRGVVGGKSRGERMYIHRKERVGYQEEIGHGRSVHRNYAIKKWGAQKIEFKMNLHLFYRFCSRSRSAR